MSSILSECNDSRFMLFFSTYLPLFTVFRWTLWRKIWPQKHTRYLNIGSDEELVWFYVFCFSLIFALQNYFEEIINFLTWKTVAAEQTKSPSVPLLWTTAPFLQKWPSDCHMTHVWRFRIWRGGVATGSGTGDGMVQKGETVETVQLWRCCAVCLPRSSAVPDTDISLRNNCSSLMTRTVRTVPSRLSDYNRCSVTNIAWLQIAIPCKSNRMKTNIPITVRHRYVWRHRYHYER